MSLHKSQERKKGFLRFLSPSTRARAIRSESMWYTWWDLSATLFLTHIPIQRISQWKSRSSHANELWRRLKILMELSLTQTFVAVLFLNWTCLRFEYAEYIFFSSHAFCGSRKINRNCLCRRNAFFLRWGPPDPST